MTEKVFGTVFMKLVKRAFFMPTLNQKAQGNNFKEC